MTSKQKFYNDMNDLADAINALAGTTGKKTIVQLIAIVQGLTPQTRSATVNENIEEMQNKTTEEPKEEK